ncbi:dTDP-4-dehydrorhamnose reductase [Rhodococcus hoagii]|uniref:dTDP-4-dehydrorhamnose reductase n=1 Tax=Rhodococcus hoagii TaxID=43767 RepID=UPI0009BE16FC|nr:dTDP-4-dehydrorhamnose reductase [Prescottella equi]NKR26828.1 dTDP-4-dehydrorhamnose reductase [Prescottella equi]NKR45493.1 dTDP-4-dehydrorhamnose reductase [Prescottella equi]NKR60083.1 dTDP-4-dehydrorhamnose reductase [Prescottella equi]NKR67654.1 dTDP-4-dehydrorhamnose reductase [Prescottella equi]NKR73352.1 dTDP-4-dehydrorhamnose reductase [Prescottella equi]
MAALGVPDSLPVRRILVTGARGQLGGRLVQCAEAAGLPVEGVGSAELDITDAGAVDSWVAPGAVVVNCAAYTAVDAAETDEAAATAVNETGARNLASACSKAGADLIHVSTDYVFSGDRAGADAAPYEPGDPTGPRTAYGRTKLAGELAIRAVLPDAHIVRTAWVYTGSGTDFVATMLRLEKEKDTVSVVDDQVGSPTYAVDLAAGLLELARVGGRPGATLHATNAGSATWFDLARAVFAGVGADPERVRPCTSAEFVRPAPRPAYSVLSPRAWGAAGLTPLRPWRDALADALAQRR